MGTAKIIRVIGLDLITEPKPAELDGRRPVSSADDDDDLLRYSSAEWSGIQGVT